MKKENNTLFILKEIGYTDLEGNRIQLNFNQKDFANALFANATSIEMDDFARSIHKDGQAILTDRVNQDLVNVITSFYSHRAVHAVREYLETINN